MIITIENENFYCLFCLPHYLTESYTLIVKQDKELRIKLIQESLLFYTMFETYEITNKIFLEDY